MLVYHIYGSIDVHIIVEWYMFSSFKFQQFCLKKSMGTYLLHAVPKIIVQCSIVANNCEWFFWLSNVTQDINSIYSVHINFNKCPTGPWPIALRMMLALQVIWVYALLHLHCMSICCGCRGVTVSTVSTQNNHASVTPVVGTSRRCIWKNEVGEGKTAHLNTWTKSNLNPTTPFLPVRVVVEQVEWY